MSFIQSPRLRRLPLLTAAMLAMAFQSGLAAEVDVTAWSIQSTIFMGSGGSSDGTTTISNPLAAVYSTSSQNSESSSIVTADWIPTGHLDFYLEAEHHCQGTGLGPGNLNSCRSGGTIYFTPQVDSLINFSAAYNHALGDGTREALLSVGLTEVGITPSIINATQRHITLVDPPVGTLSYQSDPTPLSAGTAYVVNYRLRLMGSGGSPDILSHADGYFSMQITPIPEPGTLAVLSALAPLILLRRRA